MNLTLIYAASLMATFVAWFLCIRVPGRIPRGILRAMLIVWIIALGVVFGVPVLRNDRSEWPPSAEDIFLRAHTVKFVFFGVVAAALMQAHVTIGGGVGGNAVMAAVFVVLGIAPWLILRRQNRAKASAANDLSM